MDEPCSALDPISTLAIEDLIDELKETTRSSSSPTTCSRPPASPTRPAFFNIAGTGKPGHLIEFDDTQTIFTNPSLPDTERYITGQFG